LCQKRNSNSVTNKFYLGKFGRSESFRRTNDGPNRMDGQNRIEGVKLNVPPFKGKSDPNGYLDWEMKI